MLGDREKRHKQREIITLDDIASGLGGSTLPATHSSRQWRKGALGQAGAKLYAID